MNFIITLLIATAAHAKTIPVYVQCDTAGPNIDGTLTLPDHVEGKCIPYKSDLKLEMSEVYLSETPLEIDFNNLNYKAYQVTYRFLGSTCEIDKMSEMGPSSGSWWETHSGFAAKLSLVRYGKWTGSVGDCHFMEK